MMIFVSEPKFKVLLSDDFFPDDVVDRHIKMIQNTGIRTTNDMKSFINKSIVSISLPAITHKALTQSHVYEPRIPYQSGLPSFDLIDQTVNITFRIYEGYVNWFYMFDLINTKHKSISDDRYFDWISVLILDNNTKNLFYKITYKRLILDGQLQTERLSYSNRMPDIKTFNIKFRFYTLQILNRFNEPVFEWTDQ